MKSVRIREWEDEDALALVHLSTHPYFLKQRILQYLYPDSFLHAIATIHFYKQADASRFLFRAIVYENEVCGYVQVERTKSGSCELSYWLGVDYWHQGIMEEAIQDFCKEVFAHWDIVCIYARVDKKNKASQHVLLKNEFTLKTIEHMQIFHKYR